MNTIIYPITISYCHKYKLVDNYNANSEKRIRIIHFFSIHIPLNLHEMLKSCDDFQDGKWVPLSDIRRDVSGKYFYQSEEILRSNGMLIDQMQGNRIGRILIDEAILHEIKERHELTLSIRQNIIFFKRENHSNKRMLETMIKRPAEEAKKT